MNKKTAKIAFWTYTLISLAVAALFVILSLGVEGLTIVERIGGAAWVYLLAIIVLMPIVIPWAKKKYGDGKLENQPMNPHH